MRREDQAAYILHTSPYSDSSLIVNFFSAEFGRVNALAKGGRRISRGKKQRQPLQVLTPMSVSWQGKGGLKTLIDCETQQQAHKLIGPNYYSAMYINELLLRLLPENDPAAEIFSHYTHLLLALEHGRPLQQELRQFEFLLLAQLGYQLNFEFDELGQNPIQADRFYSWRESGGFYWVDAQQSSTLVYAGADLLAIAKRQWQPASLQTAKNISRLVLHKLLGGRPLKSREIYRQMTK